MQEKIFVFNNPNHSRFSGGVFSDKIIAEKWIKKNLLSGVLTIYPLNVGVYEWAIEKDFFFAKTEQQKSSDFIGGFSSASQEHYHYENGESID
jgi:hypothetical protein